MRLVESVPWQAEVVDGPPIRLNYGDIDVPRDIDFTFIGARHDVEKGGPDFLDEVLETTDVFFLEGTGWTNKHAKDIQQVANGSYTSFKSRLAEYEALKQTDPDRGAWGEAVFKSLFESGVRVALADYPKGHPNIPAEAKANDVDYLKNPEKFGRLFATRDKFILTSMVEKITELRTMIPSIQAKDPLHVVMYYGAAHYAIHDALAAAAEEQGTIPFSSQLLFQETADMMSASGQPAEHTVTTRQALTHYQNWLRTPED